MKYCQAFDMMIGDKVMATWACIQDGMSDEEILRCMGMSEDELRIAKGDVDCHLAACVKSLSAEEMAELTDQWIELKKCMLIAASKAAYTVDAAGDSVIITCKMDYGFTITATVPEEWIEGRLMSEAEDLHDVLDGYVTWLEGVHLKAEMAAAYTPSPEQQQEIEYLDDIKNAIERFYLTVPDAHILTLMLQNLDAKTIAEKMGLGFEAVRKIRRDIIYQVYQITTEHLRIQDEFNRRVNIQAWRYSDTLWGYYETLKKAEVTLLHPVKVVKNDDVKAVCGYRMHITGNGVLDALLTDMLYPYEKELEALAAAGGCYRAIDLQYYHLLELLLEAERRMYIYTMWVSLCRRAGRICSVHDVGKDTLNVCIIETRYAGVFQRRGDMKYVLEYRPSTTSGVNPDMASSYYTADEREAAFYINRGISHRYGPRLIDPDSLQRYEKNFCI